jgi:C-terminal processing protease CtpA/Prc
MSRQAPGGFGRLWLRAAVIGLAALAVALSGPRLRAEQKEDVQKEQPKDTKKGEPEDLQKQIDQLRKEVEELRKSMDQFRRGMPGFAPGADAFGQFQFPVGRRGDGRLGVMVDTPGEVLADQLGLEKDKGLVIMDVVTDSAAAKAGLKAHDVLVQFDGKAVPRDPREFNKMVQDVKANTAVDVVVIRKGKQETIKGVTLPEPKPERRPGFFRIAPRGVTFRVGCGF